ncbi:unnamed protein product [Prunus armeniaca]|uniref:RNase H type-1 domain-containing protein n=1 Tax=Prunus armeniaca TaxID=36596 RepID=A0A6J5WW66_PRUAR|nr:unnamed protein product [Prunus armeniaca]
MLLNHRWSSLLVPEKWWQTPHVGFFKLIDACSKLVAVLATELYTLKAGISFAVNASFLPLLTESDSLTATQLLLKEEACYVVKGVLVEEIR